MNILTETLYKILLAVDDGKDHTITEIVNCVDMTYSHIAKVLTKLSVNGYMLDKGMCGRKRMFCLTPKGKRLLKSMESL